MTSIRSFVEQLPQGIQLAMVLSLIFLPLTCIAYGLSKQAEADRYVVEVVLDREVALVRTEVYLGVLGAEPYKTTIVDARKIRGVIYIQGIEKVEVRFNVDGEGGTLFIAPNESVWESVLKIGEGQEVQR